MNIFWSRKLQSSIKSSDLVSLTKKSLGMKHILDPKFFLIDVISDYQNGE